MNKSLRHFIPLLAVLMLSSAWGVPGAFAQQIPLPGSAIPQFIDPLPNLHTIIDDGSQIVLESTEFQSPVMPTGFVPAAGAYDGTWVWGYRTPGQTNGPNIGPVIVAERGFPTEIKWVNNLGDAATTNVLAYKNSTDQTLHWADPENLGCMMDLGGAAPDQGSACAMNYSGPIPDVSHLHGGEQPAEIDGGPDAWYTSNGASSGAGYYTEGGTLGSNPDNNNFSIYRYLNTQEAAPLWFHPHPLGVTRLNVYAGLAGAYILTDPAKPLPAGLPGPADIVPMVIQDRMFDTNGQLYFPNVGINPEHPFWIPEFVGDTIVVNGKVWPFQNVEQKRYRFFILNGSNARVYELFLTDPVTKAFGPSMWVIGTGGGYLDTPVKLDPALGQKLLVMPGERYEVIIDFADTTNNPTPSGTYLLRNTARTPYPKGETPNGSTLGRILQFRVGAVPGGGDNSYNPDPTVAGGGQTLRPSNPIQRLVDPVAGTAAVAFQKTRQLTLNEVMGPGGPLEILVNNTKWNGRVDGTGGPVNTGDAPVSDAFGNYLTEQPQEGETELWEIVNLTADAHPIHLHLVQFQLMNRQNLNTSRYNRVYNAAFGGAFVPAAGPPNAYNTPNADGAVGGNPAVGAYLQGPITPPKPQEAGWKDTVTMLPGQVTRIMVRFAPLDVPAGTTPAAAFYPFDPSLSDYVWHCHILDHEDNEMMRPYKVIPNGSASRVYVQGADY